MSNLAVIIKSSAAAMAMAAASNSINGLSIPLIGIPLTAVTMSAAGAMCAFAWPKTETSRAKLFAVTLASTFIGAACVTVIPAAFHREWPTELQGPLAFLFGLIAPWAVPAIRSAVPSFVGGLANLILRMVGAKAGAEVPYEPPPRKPAEREE